MGLSDATAQSYLELFEQGGPERLYRALIGRGVIQSLGEARPEIDLLAQGEDFLRLFRQTGDPKYLEVSRCARKAAHTLYRHLCREGEAPDGDGRFLRLIR